MQIVESSIRPPRIALAISTAASERVLRRVFRLLGGKWGGYYDVIALFDGEGTATRFWSDLLRAADPDYVLVADPNLSFGDVTSAIGRLRLQPFEVARLKEREERRTPWRQLFREMPTRPDHQGPRSAILDLDPARAKWRTIARCGLPNQNTRHELVAPNEGGSGAATFPITYGRLGLTSRPMKGPSWVIFGDLDDPLLACRYWSLRAIGRSPLWQRAGAIKSKRLKTPTSNSVVYAPTATEDEVSEAVERWTTQRKSVKAADDDSAQEFPSGRLYLASESQTVTPYEGFWRISLPSPPPLEDDYASVTQCVAEIKLLSPNPEDPDGIVLAPTTTSQELVGSNEGSPLTRITARGIARIGPLSKLALTRIPHISYREAVDAAFAEHDFTLTPSDKGLYQQRSLELADGLRYLAWMLRQPESRLLLQVFFEYHGTGRAPPRYRRAVRYDELQDILLKTVRERIGSLRGPWKKRADTWLASWVDGLLARGILLGGHVLRCPVCADRSFYRLEALGQRFECRRCMAESPMPGNTPRSFQLNEAVYQLIEHDGEVTTLTLSTLRESANLSFLYLPEIVSRHEQVRRELDIAALVDGELVIAEVKSNAKLSKKEIKNSGFVARNARAQRMLFATLTRSSPLCEKDECDSCIAKHGEHHADQAWSEEIRVEIQKMREMLGSFGTRVESLCWHSLHSDFEDQERPLAPFRR